MTFGGVGMAALDQLADHRDHVADMLGGARHLVGVEIAQRMHVIEIPLGGGRGDLVDRHAALLGAGDDLVVHVGEIAHIGHVIGPVDMAQQPVEHIEHDDGPRIAQMRAVIDRRPADIHPHVGRIERLEILLRAGGGVVEFDRGHVVLARTGLPRRA